MTFRVEPARALDARIAERDRSAVDIRSLGGAQSRSSTALDRRQFLGGSWRRGRTDARAERAAASGKARLQARVRAERLAETLHLIATIDGAQIHASDPRGLVEVAADAARADAVLLALTHMPHVLSAALVSTAEDFSA